MEYQKTHWIIRCNDGENFNNSKNPFWGVKRGKNGCIKTIVNKLKQGDILWFMTSKSFGGQLIGMVEYINYYDRTDEPLIRINTLSNKEQGWKGDDNWDLQLHYCNLYDIRKQNIKACIQCGGIVLEYNTFKKKLSINLEEHYKNYIFYAETCMRFVNDFDK